MVCIFVLKLPQNLLFSWFAWPDGPDTIEWITAPNQSKHQLFPERNSFSRVLNKCSVSVKATLQYIVTTGHPECVVLTSFF